MLIVRGADMMVMTRDMPRVVTPMIVYCNLDFCGDFFHLPDMRLGAPAQNATFLFWVLLS